MDWFLVAVLWGHVLAAAFWIGGMLFLSLVFVPLLRSEAYPVATQDSFRMAAHRFRLGVWIAIGFLGFTGLYLLAHHGLLSAPVKNWPSIVWTKLVLGALVILLAALHDFVIGPRSGAIRKQRKDWWTRRGNHIIRLSSWLARFTLILSLGVLFAAVLVRKTF